MTSEKTLWLVFVLAQPAGRCAQGAAHSFTLLLHLYWLTAGSFIRLPVSFNYASTRTNKCCALSFGDLCPDEKQITVNEYTEAACISLAGKTTTQSESVTQQHSTQMNSPRLLWPREMGHKSKRCTAQCPYFTFCLDTD